MRKKLLFGSLVSMFILAFIIRWTVTTPDVNRVAHSVAEPGSVRLQDLVAQNESIVEVSVLSAQANFDDKDRVVYTFSEAKVDKVWAGPMQVGQVFSVRIRGGSVGQHSTIPDDLLPPLAPHAKHVLFLSWRHSDERPDLDGWYLTSRWQGRAEILEDGTLRLTNPHEEHPLKQWAGKPVSALEMAVARAHTGR